MIFLFLFFVREFAIKILSTTIQDLKIIEPNVHLDDRGFFLESFNSSKFNEALNLDIHFVQDNHSYSKKGVLRGLHYQAAPFSQGKLVRVVEGEVWDVALDIRENSASFGKWFGLNLSANNFKQLWIPEGFAHGFYVLSDFAQVEYKATNFYSPDHERTIHWKNNLFNIEWPLINDFVFLSSRDN
nr:dTDP-4-dehydrorhamnose 3,5-epimerase [Candidatus Methylopumilus universalis]